MSKPQSNEVRARRASAQYMRRLRETAKRVSPPHISAILQEALADEDSDVRRAYEDGYCAGLRKAAQP